MLRETPILLFPLRLLAMKNVYFINFFTSLFILVPLLDLGFGMCVMCPSGKMGMDVQACHMASLAEQSSAQSQFSPSCCCADTSCLDQSIRAFSGTSVENITIAVPEFLISRICKNHIVIGSKKIRPKSTSISIHTAVPLYQLNSSFLI